ncbi:MAG: cytochrome c-type biogenesis protein CcmH [Alphaproteobacteria bacterium]|jgi:hypothetical protein|nr:cytochrome c-type biogenesis protein CcmH [Alphaproteobacteria bacterium]|tara:strand:- start:542 stop:1003 length:462 start_codon:yes stop_codon:yes gene_type:complete
MPSAVNHLARGVLLALLLLMPSHASALSVQEVARDLACPCECPLILEDCNMTCGLDWKDEIGRMIGRGMNKQQIIDYFVQHYGDEVRLTTLQRIEGKVFQYTRGFSDMEWALLWAGVGIWTLLLFGGFYLVLRKLVFNADRARGAALSRMEHP